MKIVINVKRGGFGLSCEAVMLYAELSGFRLYHEKINGFSYYYRIPVDEFHKLANEHSTSPSILKSLRFFHEQINRADPTLVKVVEELGDKANDRFSALKVVSIPDDVDWMVQDDEGSEWVAERHRIWY